MLAKSQQEIKAGQLLGYIDNPANYDDVSSLKLALKSFNILNPSDSQFHSDWKLGELTSKYYQLISAIQSYRAFYSANIFIKQVEDLDISIAQGR